MGQPSQQDMQSVNIPERIAIIVFRLALVLCTKYFGINYHLHLGMASMCNHKSMRFIAHSCPVHSIVRPQPHVIYVYILPNWDKSTMNDELCSTLTGCVFYMPSSNSGSKRINKFSWVSNLDDWCKNTGKQSLLW